MRDYLYGCEKGLSDLQKGPSYDTRKAQQYGKKASTIRQESLFRNNKADKHDNKT